MADGDAKTLPAKPAEEARGWKPWHIGVAIVVAAAASAAGYARLGGHFFGGPITPTVVAPAAPPQPAQPADPRAAVVGGDAPVLVRFSLDNSYPDSELPLLDAALQVLPAREVAIAAPTVMADLIRAQFAVTADAKPGLYARLDADIRQRSEIVNGLVAPGTARIPLLPPFTAASNNLPAFISVRMGRERSGPAALLMPNGQPFSPDSLNPPSQTTYVVTATEKDLQPGPLQTLAFSQGGSVLAKQVLITLADGAAPLNPPYPTYVLAGAGDLRQTLANGHRTVTLYILDTGWPDAQEWKSSVTELSRLCAATRAWYSFPSASAPIDPSGTFPSPPDPHVVNVKRSLQQPAALSKQVKVVYVPMTLAQQSAPLLREIVRLGLAIDNLPSEDAQPPKSVGRAAYARVTEAQVDGAMSTISAGISDGRFDANSALLHGLFLIAARDAADSGGGYFVNESWTTDDQTMINHPVEAPWGFVVAAAGNADPVNISQTKVAFASLSRIHRDILAVLTMNAQGTEDCKTSRVTFVPEDLGAVGYFGQISSTECYSSFAAPRVAWFLAARDTLRTTAVSSPEDWKLDIRDRINKLRAKTDPAPQSYLFDPVRYIK